MGKASGKVGITATGVDNHAEAEVEAEVVAPELESEEIAYNEMSKAELVEASEAADLPTSGMTKAELIAGLTLSVS